MRDEAQLRRLVDSTSLLGQLARIVAPKPRLFVFPEVHGPALDLQRDPETHQRLIGMSGELYRRLRNKIHEEQNANLDERVASTMMSRGRSTEIAIAKPARWLDPHASVFDALDELPFHRIELRPKVVRL